MRVLFISSFNAGGSPIVVAQAKSLLKYGLDIRIHGIHGKGFIGYIKNILPLYKVIKELNPDHIHAHYSFCGIVSSLATRKPVICSLMGSDVKSSGLWRLVIRFFVKRVWASTIVKSEDMKQSLGLKCVNVIPNGVDMDLFKPMDRSYCRAKLAWSPDKRIVLFAANPARPEKNYTLADQAIKALNSEDIELKVVHGIKHEDMPIYLNAVDVLLLTSLWEGSPNVIKEAMACNTPIVSVDVGDVRWLLEGVDGCYHASKEPVALSAQLNQIFQNIRESRGRERLIELGLDAESVAKRIVGLYKEIIRGSDLETKRRGDLETMRGREGEMRRY